MHILGTCTQVCTCVQNKDILGTLPQMLRLTPIVAHLSVYMQFLHYNKPQSVGCEPTGRTQPLRLSFTFSSVFSSRSYTRFCFCAKQFEMPSSVQFTARSCPVYLHCECKLDMSGLFGLVLFLLNCLVKWNRRIYCVHHPTLSNKTTRLARRKNWTTGQK